MKSVFIKRALALLAVVVIFVLILVLASFNKTSPPSQNKVSEVPVNKLPDYFPAIPVDVGAKVINNYNVVSPDGNIQATRTMESPASVLSNFIFYKEYLGNKNNGWAILGEVNNASVLDHKALFAKNSFGVLNINISASPKGSIVDISFLALKPAK